MLIREVLHWAVLIDAPHWDGRPEVVALELPGWLEKHYRDMQDIEFTVERGKLWMLQTRSGKRTAKAALLMAVAGRAPREALARVDWPLLLFFAGLFVVVLLAVGSAYDFGRSNVKKFRGESRDMALLGCVLVLWLLLARGALHRPYRVG